MGVSAVMIHKPLYTLTPFSQNRVFFNVDSPLSALSISVIKIYYYDFLPSKVYSILYLTAWAVGQTKLIFNIDCKYNFYLLFILRY